MPITLKDMIKLVTPPVFIQLAKRLGNKRQMDAYGLSGNYTYWYEAQAASTGYDSEIILEKTKAALLKVKNGKAVYERDSVLFDEIQYAWPMLAGLMWAAARSGGRLNVLDFGGSLGTSYFQNRVFLSSLPEVRWNIVEQARHVEAGRMWFEDDRLHFYTDISECLANTQPNLVLLSGVLQVLEHPYIILDQLFGLPCDQLIIDRTPFWSGLTDRLCVQTVPPRIYPASYPSWIFSITKFRSHLNKDWDVVEEFESIDKLNAPVKLASRGLLLVRKHQYNDRRP